MNSAETPAALGEVLLSVRSVVRRFGSTTVLDGVDLEVRAGEVVMLTGPSGSGKSTLLHLLAALDTPDEGQIVIDGYAVRRHHNRNLSGFRRDHVGIIFQLHNLIPRLSARQNIEIAMFGSRRSRRERVARADELLAQVGLEHRASSRPPTMSGGERQRVAVARGLANNPRLLLADEPSGSLDDVSTAVIARTMRSLADAQHVAVLVVSHDARLLSVADRVVHLDGGRIIDVTGPASSVVGPAGTVPDRSAEEPAPG